MREFDNKVWQNPLATQLTEVLVSLKSEQAMQNFLRDVMTEPEILEISARLEAAKMLNNGSTYAEITKRTRLSSRTVARISKWMKNGYGGYWTALESITNSSHSHI